MVHRLNQIIIFLSPICVMKAEYNYYSLLVLYFNISLSGYFFVIQKNPVYNLSYTRFSRRSKVHLRFGSDFSWNCPVPYA